VRLTILILCALIAAGVFAVMFFALWRSHRRASPGACFRQSFATELMWAAIPCLMILAAASPAVIAIATGSAPESRALFGKVAECRTAGTRRRGCVWDEAHTERWRGDQKKEENCCREQRGSRSAVVARPVAPSLTGRGAILTPAGFGLRGLLREPVVLSR